MHMMKAKGASNAMTSHIERKRKVENADPERTYLNRELIEFPEGIKNRTEAIQHRLDTAGLTRNGNPDCQGRKAMMQKRNGLTTT